MTTLMNNGDPTGLSSDISAFDGSRIDVAASNSRRQERLRAITQTAYTGINSVTGLASDFLNQFNEVSMILNMTHHNQDLFADLKLWQPLSYAEHFRTSGFQDLDLILEAYSLCPRETRIAFDSHTEKLGSLIIERLSELETTQIENYDERAAAYLDLSIEIRQQVEKLSALIHPTEALPTNADVSTLFASRRANT